MEREIAEAWSLFAGGDGSGVYDGAVLTWRRLYDSAFRGDRWHVNASTAHLITTLNEHAAFHVEDYSRVNSLAQRFLGAKFFSAVDADDVAYHQIRSGIALILLNEIDEGVAAMYPVVHKYRRRNAYWLLEIVHMLRGVCSVMPAENKVPAPVASLAAELVGSLHNYFMKRPFPSTSITYAELLAAISAPSGTPNRRPKR